MKVALITGDDLLERTITIMRDYSNDPQIKCLHLIMCDENGFTLDDYARLAKTELPLFGGIFPQIIYNEKAYDRGIIVAGFEEVPRINVIKNLSSEDTNFEQLIDDSILDDGYRTLFVFVDAFSQRITDYIEGLFRIYGIEINYVGGGAGSLELVQKPCILTNEGLLSDAAVMAAFKFKSGVGVKHGWDKLYGSFKVTKSEKNILQMLDNRPAFEVFRELIKEKTGILLTRENFFETVNGFPLAIKKIGADSIVRDPVILMPDNGIFCMGDIPCNSFVDIMQGLPDRLIAASEDAFNDALNEIDQTKPTECVYFIDCISRVIYLGAVFSKELASVKMKDVITFGALTIGEIANSGNDYLEFYNKTSVVTLIQKS
jgi:hypothetical protein